MSYNVKNHTLEVRPAKIQISFHIIAVWSEAFLGAFYFAKDVIISCWQYDSDLIALMPRLIEFSLGEHVGRRVFSRCSSNEL